MKSSYIVVIVLVVAAAAMVIYSLQGGPSSEEYNRDVEKERQEKNDLMKNGAESPFGEHKAEFKTLNYFAPDIAYRIVADLQPIDNKKVVTLTTSDGQDQQYLEYAYASFALNGVDSKLLILEVMDSGPYRGTLFLAFADDTSAKETYGAGRYLDIKKVPGASTITLDFNKAYNPYCAYSDKYSCPFPPKNNILKVAVNAGEKSYHR